MKLALLSLLTLFVISNLNAQDVTPPDSLLPEVLSQTDTSFTVSLTAKDSVGVVGYYVLSYDKQDTIKNILGDTIVTTINGLVDDSLNVFWAVAYDAAGNKSIEEPIGVLVGQDDSKFLWANDRRITTTVKTSFLDVFTVKFSVIAANDLADAAIAVCQRKVVHEVDWNAHAIIFRLRPDGYLDCRNNGSYMKDSVITYVAGDKFDVLFVINPTDTIYDCYVSKNGGEDILLAKDYYFRNKQNYTQLKDVAYMYVGNPIIVSNVKWDVKLPSSPKKIVSSNITINSVKLRWNASINNDSIKGYNVNYGNNKVFVTDTTAIISGLTHSTQYNFTVRAVDNEGNESIQGEAVLVTTATPTDLQPPSVPGTPYAIYVNKNNVMLNWGASTDNVGVTSYKVYINGTDPIIVNKVGYLLFTDLNYDTQYTFTVSALDAIGNESELSPGFTFLAPSDTLTPSPPTDLIILGVTTSSLVLTWNASTDNRGVIGYNVYINGTYSKTTAIEFTIINNLNPKTQYSFTVTAVDSIGNESAHSVPLQVSTIESGTNITIISGIKIYPNPLNAHKELKIDLGDVNTKGITISMSNLVGQTVYAKSVSTNNNFITIPTQNFANGVYILSIKSQDNILKQEKIIVY